MKCLTKEEVTKAWLMERGGRSQIAVAREFHISDRALRRLYRYYGLGSPNRKCK